jgi:hypothetical protein
MYVDWPLTIALLLILLKQLYKLFLHHRPDPVDYLKAVAALPLDVSFLVVGLFIKAASAPTSPAQTLIGMMVIYLIVSLLATVLWRICDGGVTSRFGGHFVWAFPLNAALAGSAFYVAMHYVK